MNLPELAPCGALPPPPPPPFYIFDVEIGGHSQNVQEFLSSIHLSIVRLIGFITFCFHGYHSMACERSQDKYPSFYKRNQGKNNARKVKNLKNFVDLDK